jgi:hypothetical protein
MFGLIPQQRGHQVAGGDSEVGEGSRKMSCATGTFAEIRPDDTTVWSARNHVGVSERLRAFDQTGER